MLEKHSKFCAVLMLKKKQIQNFKENGFSL